MAYATVADVEERLGFTLDDGEAQSLTAFLEDMSFLIDDAIEQIDKTPEDFNENKLKMFVARKGVDFYLYSSREGASSISETVGDTSRSISYNGGSGSSNGLFLSTKDKKFLGLISSGFITWNLVKDKGAR